MEPVSPNQTAKKSLAEVDLLTLPGVAQFTRAWRELIYANRSARREGKALLFGELAEAAKRGVPLQVALNLSSQTADEGRYSRAGKWGRGADTRHTLLFSLLVSAMLLACALLWEGTTRPVVSIAIPFGLILYVILSFRYVDADRIARLLAKRLLRYVDRGFPLAVAMERCGLDFEPSEIAMVRAGVQWGRVHVALKRLTEFQAVENRLTMQGSQMLYPLLLACMLSFPVMFIIVKIIPTYVDIYTQLGAVLPAKTQGLIRMVNMFAHGAVLILGVFVFGVLVLFMVVRSIMNGNPLSKVVAVVPALGGVVVAGLALFVHVAKAGRAGLLDGEGLEALGKLASAILGLLFLPWILWVIERIVLEVERWVGSLLSYLPFFQTPARAQAEARWLGALALAIECGVPEAAALRSAGDICGGRWRSRSQDAAHLVEGGLGLGEACVKENVLSGRMNQRLVLAGVQGDFVAALRATAEDSTQNAYDCINRSGRIAEVVAIVLIGIVLSGFVMALYIPLLSFSTVVGP